MTRLPKDYLIAFPCTSTMRAQSELTRRPRGCLTQLVYTLVSFFFKNLPKHLSEILILSKKRFGEKLLELSQKGTFVQGLIQGLILQSCIML